MVVSYGEYKNNKLIILKRNEDDKFPFSFGVGKGKLILEHYKDIEKFVEENDKPKVETEQM